MNVYATATLSGDVANALALLKRMTRPTARKQKAGLLIPPKELACCHVRLSFAIDALPILNICWLFICLCLVASLCECEI